jgi:hypothetical protein
LVTLKNSLFNFNNINISGNSQGVGLYLQKVNVTSNNITLFGNNGRFGVGGYLGPNSVLNFVGITIANNTATGLGAGFAIDSTVSGTIDSALQ